MKYLIIGDPSGSVTIHLIDNVGVLPSDIFVWEDSTKGQYSVTIEGATATDNLDDYAGMKFDTVIGNPPYTDTSSVVGAKGGGMSSALDTVFFMKAMTLSSRVSLIIRSKHFAKAGSKFRRQLFSTGCVESITYLPADTFPSISLTETCIVTYDENHTGSTTVTFADGSIRELNLTTETCIRLTNPDYVPVVDNNIAHRHQRGAYDLNELLPGSCPMVTTMGGKKSTSPLLTYVDSSQHVVGVGQHGVIMNDKYGGEGFGGLFVKDPSHSISGSAILLRTDNVEESQQLLEYLQSDAVLELVRLNKISNVHSKELFKTIPDFL